MSFSEPIAHLAASEQVHILLEEYRALNGLLLYRLSAMDRRLPVAGGTIAALVGSIVTLPTQAQLVVLLTLPALLLWLMRTVVAHARSKEDVLRRLDEIERHVNQLVGAELLLFQSRHPNQGHAVAGRSGADTVHALLAFCLALLGTCMFLFLGGVPGGFFRILYGGYAVAVACDLVCSLGRLRGYRYVKAPSRYRPCPSQPF